MRLLRFRHQDRPAVGVMRDGLVMDVTHLVPHAAHGLERLLAAEMGAHNALGQLAEQIANTGASGARSGSRNSAFLDPAEIEYLPPIAAPQKILCLGLNYFDHAAETKLEPAKYPIIFARYASSFVAHGQALIRPKLSHHFDYEGELVAVIGKRCRQVDESQALDYVAGYSLFNDGSIRDYQRKGRQWTVGKNFDGSGGFGPWLVSADELPPGAVGLRLQTRLNDQVMQDANTADMIFSVAKTVALLSAAMTLEPGDVLVMGTPAGVGFTRKPPVYLQPGDICDVEIESIGVLRNPVVDEDE